jgi:hypothetical protein
MSAGAAPDRRQGDPAVGFLAEPRRAPPGWHQFSLESLLLVTTLIATCLGVAVTVPSIGGPVAVVALLSLVRTIAECRRFLQDGQRLSLADKCTSFGRSLCYSYLTLVGTLLTVFFLSAVAILVGGAVHWIAGELGGNTARGIIMPIVAVTLAVAVIVGSGVVFILIYWKTLSPRLMLDLQPHSKPTETDFAR